MNRTVSVVSLLVLASLAGTGCSTMAPSTFFARTDAGVVEMDWTSRRNIELVEHTCRRDRLGHIVVAVRLVNTSDEPYYASFCVDFRDAVGGYERRAHQTDTEKLPPGPTSMEWTSYGDDASHYVVRIKSSRLWQW